MSTAQPGLGAAPPPPPTGERLEIPWRRLNARMLIVRPLSDLVRFIPGIALLFLLGHAQGRGNWWGLIGVGVALAFGVYRWFTTTFRISAEQVQVRSGLVNRKTLTVPIDRVRTVDVTAPALHRLLGLARVTVGTGQSDRKDDLLKLDALGATEAERLAGELLHRHRQVVAESTPESGPGTRAAPPPPAPGLIGADARQGELVRFEGSWIRFGPFTLSGLVTVFIVAGFVARYVSEVGINYGQLPGVAAAEQRAAAGGLVALIVVLALLLIAIVVVLSTLSYVVAFWGFQVSRQAEGTLQVRRGLITTRVVTIEERRLRGVELSEPLLLRLVRGARCLAITTGLRVGRGAERGGSMLLPPGPRALAERVAGDVLGDRRPLRAALRRHGPRASRRRFTRALLAAAILCVLLLVGCRLLRLPVALWIASFAVFPLAALLAWDRARSLGHTVQDGWLVLRIGSLVRRTSIIRHEGVIGWNVRQSFFQRRLGLVSLAATTAAGRQHYEAQDVTAEAALGVCEEVLPGMLRPFLTPQEQPSALPPTMGGFR